MKTFLISIVLLISCLCSFAQDSMNKKMENKSDKMVKKMDNTGDKMNKKLDNASDSSKRGKTVKPSDSVYTKPKAKPLKKKEVI